MKAERDNLRSVQIALEILEAVAFAGEELGVTQIAERVEMTKGSVHRHLQTLVDRGYLAQNMDTTRYGVGEKGRLLARKSPETDIVKIAQAPMRELRDFSGQTVVLTGRTALGALVLATVRGTTTIEIGVRAGSVLAFHSSAQGKVLLAHAPKAARERVLRSQLVAFNTKTIVTREELETELEQIRRSGYASAPEETLLGVNAIAVPIFDGSDNCTASIAVAGSIQHVAAVPDGRTLAAVVEAGRIISRSIGHERTAHGQSTVHARHRSEGQTGATSVDRNPIVSKAG